MRTRLVLLCLVVLLWVSATTAAEPKHVLLLGQKPDGHPPSTHEYLPGQRVLAALLSRVDGIEVQIVQADEPWKDGPELLAKADGAVLFLSEGAKWVSAEPRRLDAFAKMVQRGGGLVTLHWAMGTKAAEPIGNYLKLFGGCHGGPDRKYKVVQDASVRVIAANHPVTHGLANFTVPREEFYYRLKFVQPAEQLTPLLQVTLDDNDETVCWAWDRPDGGRSFGFSGLHFHENWKLDAYRRLIVQAVLWSVKVEVPKELKLEVSEADLKLK